MRASVLVGKFALAGGTSLIGQLTGTSQALESGLVGGTDVRGDANGPGRFVQPVSPVDQKKITYPIHSPDFLSSVGDVHVTEKD